MIQSQLLSIRTKLINMTQNTSTKLSGALSNLKNLSNNFNAEAFNPHPPAANSPFSFSNNTPSIQPNHQQQTILDAPLSPSIIRAYAGCGKTTLLKWLAQKHCSKNRILYIALNSAIANSAQEQFANSATCKTTHSVAMKFIRQKPEWGFKINNKLNPLNSFDIANQLELQGKKRLMLANLYRQGVLSFIGSKDKEATTEHIPKLFYSLQEQANVSVELFLKQINQLWEIMSNPDSKLPLTHDGYLKLWCLEGAPFDSDIVLLDEAQDTNDALAHQISKNNSLFYLVGDSFQSIYSFRGATDALEIFSPNATEFILSQTQRFGGDIQKIVNTFLFFNNAKEPVQSTKTKGSFNNMGCPPGKESLFIARSNIGLFKKAILLAQNNTPFSILGDAPFFNTNPSTLKHLADLKAGKPWEHQSYGTIYNIEKLEELAQTNSDASTVFSCALFKLFGNNSSSKIDGVISASQKSEKALITLSTTHKAKGLQSPWIQLADDFLLPEVQKKQLFPISSDNKEESNIFYVALTRAQEGIFFTNPEHYLWACEAKKFATNPIQYPTLQKTKIEGEKFFLKEKVAYLGEEKKLSKRL